MYLQHILFRFFGGLVFLCLSVNFLWSEPTHIEDRWRHRYSARMLDGDHLDIYFSYWMGGLGKWSEPTKEATLNDISSFKICTSPQENLYNAGFLIYLKKSKYGSPLYYKVYAPHYDPNNIHRPGIQVEHAGQVDKSRNVDPKSLSIECHQRAAYVHWTNRGEDWNEHCSATIWKYSGMGVTDVRCERVKLQGKNKKGSGNKGEESPKQQRNKNKPNDKKKNGIECSIKAGISDIHVNDPVHFVLSAKPDTGTGYEAQWRAPLSSEMKIVDDRKARIQWTKAGSYTVIAVLKKGNVEICRSSIQVDVRNSADEKSTDVSGQSNGSSSHVGSVIAGVMVKTGTSGSTTNRGSSGISKIKKVPQSRQSGVSHGVGFGKSKNESGKSHQGRYRAFVLSRPDPKLCREACEKDSGCKSWIYIKPNTIQGSRPRCWLGSVVSEACISGVKKISKPPKPQGSKGRFDYPKIGKYRLDWCYSWGSGCGAEAANAFCRKMGYARAVSWSEDEDIGDRKPTKIISSGRICSERFCDGFKYIECAGKKKTGPSSGVKNGARFIGCFKDKGDPYGTKGRDLSGAGYLFDNSMSVERCIALCGKKGYRYAGVQYGNQCFCGNRYGKYGRAKNCDMKCAGNAREICGGFWANSIYKVSKRGGRVPGAVHGGANKNPGTQSHHRGMTTVSGANSGHGTKIGHGMEQSIDRLGGDYRNFDLPRPDPRLCQEACEKDSRCKAWTYVKPNTFQGPHPRCWLKNVVPPPKKNNACISGVKAESPEVSGENKPGTGRKHTVPGGKNVDETINNCKKYYRNYIDSYNRVTQLISSGKGDTEEAKEAYKIYKRSRSLYLSCQNRSESKTVIESHPIENGKSDSGAIYNTAEGGENFTIDNPTSSSGRTGRGEGIVLVDTVDMLSNKVEDKRKPESVRKTEAGSGKAKRCAAAYSQYLAAYQALTRAITDPGISDLTLLKHLHGYRKAWREYSRCTGVEHKPSRPVKGSASTYDGLCAAEFKAYEESYERISEGMDTLEDLPFIRLRQAYLRAKKSYESCLNGKEKPRQEMTAERVSVKDRSPKGGKKVESSTKRDIIVYAGSKLNNAIIATRKLPSGEPDGYTITDHLPNGSTPFYLFVYYEGVKPTDRIGVQWYYRPFGRSKETLLFEEKGGRLPAEEGVFSAGPISIEGGSFPSGEYHLILTLNGKKEIEKFFTIGEGE